MNLIEAQTRLLSNRKLRERFVEDPVVVARDLGVAESDLAALCGLNVEQLNHQAQALVFKRMHEVRKLIPSTCANLGAEFEQTFLRYAETNWPKGHRRNLIDAVGFLESLEAGRHPAVCAVEASRLRFLASGRRLGIGLNRSRNTLIALTALWRWKGEPREWTLSFGGRREKAIEVPMARPVPKA